VSSSRRLSHEARWLRELEHDDQGVRAHAAVRLAEVAREAGEVERAQSLLQTVCHTGDPTFAPRAAFALGQLLADEGEAHKAELAFTLASNLSRPDHTPDVKLNLAARWAASGRLADAVAAYTSVLDAIGPASEDWMHEEAAIAALRLGDLLAYDGDVASAQDAYRYALGSGDDEVTPHAALALASLISSHDDREGEIDALLQLVLALDHPDCSPNAALWLAARAAECGEHARAYELLNLVIQCEHPHYTPQAQRGRDALLQGQTRRYLQDVLELNYRWPVNSPVSPTCATLHPFAPAAESSQLPVNRQTGNDQAQGLTRLQPYTRVPTATIRVSFAPTDAHSLARGTAGASASKDELRSLSDRFYRVLQVCASAVLGPDAVLDIVTPSATASDGNMVPVPAPDLGERDLHPRFTFDHFIIGRANRLAHAAALTVAELPRQAYNPLFIHGPRGIGKTHLLHAIGTYIRAQDRSLHVRAASSQQFASEFAAVTDVDQLARFRDSCRGVDVLLIDDIHCFIEADTAVQREFLDTLTALRSNQSQVIMAASSSAGDLSCLDAGLDQYCKSGLVAEMGSPDLPTRVAILRHRAYYDQIEIADEAALRLIAERVTANIRTLEGALIRVVAFSSLTGQPITSSLVQNVLDSLYPSAESSYASSPETGRTEDRLHSVADIQAATCARVGMSLNELLSPTRATRASWYRQIAMYLAREMSGESWLSIGRDFNGLAPGAVRYAWQRVSSRLRTDPDAKLLVREIIARLDHGYAIERLPLAEQLLEQLLKQAPPERDRVVG
jgi:chromosomal replication initiator protein